MSSCFHVDCFDSFLFRTNSHLSCQLNQTFSSSRNKYQWKSIDMKARRHKRCSLGWGFRVLSIIYLFQCEISVSYVLVSERSVEEKQQNKATKTTKKTYNNFKGQVQGLGRFLVSVSLQIIKSVKTLLKPSFFFFFFSSVNLKLVINFQP